MYTIIMYAFHCVCFVFKEKHCTLSVYITEFFLKSGGGGQNALLPPPSNWGGGHGPLAPLWRTPCFLWPLTQEATIALLIQKFFFLICKTIFNKNLLKIFSYFC